MRYTRDAKATCGFYFGFGRMDAPMHRVGFHVERAGDGTRLCVLSPLPWFHLVGYLRPYEGTVVENWRTPQPGEKWKTSDGRIVEIVKQSWAHGIWHCCHRGQVEPYRRAELLRKVEEQS